MKKNQILFIAIPVLIIIPFMIYSFTLRSSLPKNYDSIEIILKTGQDSVKTYKADITTQHHIISGLKKSRRISILQVIKEALEEGVYIIKIHHGETISEYT